MGSFMGDKQDRLSEQFLKQAKRSKDTDETLEARLLRESRVAAEKQAKRDLKAKATRGEHAPIFIDGVPYTGLSADKAAEIRAKIDDDVNNREQRKAEARAERRATAKERKAAELKAKEDQEAADFKAMIARRAKEQIAKRNNESK